jgi:hypothetical protein
VLVVLASFIRNCYEFIMRADKIHSKKRADEEDLQGRTGSEQLYNHLREHMALCNMDIWDSLPTDINCRPDALPVLPRGPRI